MGYKAFVSSTFEDLKEHRAHVIRTLRRAGFIVDPMEDWTADSAEPKQFSQDRLNGCDLCVLLVGFRRGYVPDGSTRSITQLEYDAAMIHSVDILPFLLDEKAPWPRDFDELDKDPEIRSWRAHLGKRHGRELFTLVPQSIDMAGALGRWLSKQNKSPEGEQNHPRINDSVSIRHHNWDIQKNGSPYPGLMYFTKYYASVFFGRDSETEDVLDRMCLPEGRFILVSGNSGTGKSSLVDAGVLSEIEWKRAPLPGTATCLCVRMVPSHGYHPFSALMGALHPYTTRAGLDPKRIETELIASPSRLAHFLQLILSKGTEHDALVLFLDQTEELFTAQDPDAANRFLKSLVEATHGKRLWVLATIRSDHLHHCHEHVEMRAVLSGNGHYALGPIKPFLLPDLILKPARCAGLKITDHLAQRILHDMGPQGGHLPLLGFVLNQLFKQRLNCELSEAVYEQLGGIQGAIAHHAADVEAAVQREQGTVVATLLPKLFQSLVIMDAERLPTRRRPLRSQFSAAMMPLIDVLIHERLLYTEAQDQSATVSISHEALFGAWPSLREYVAKNQKQLMDQTLLESRARKWVEMDEPWFSGLASGREYRDFRRAEVTGTVSTKNYLYASRRALCILNSGIAIVILLILGTTWLWQKGYGLEQASLKIRSLFRSIHVFPEMIMVDGGAFRQGDTRGDGAPVERPVHTVKIRPFALGRFEVTFEEYDRYAIAEGQPFPGDQGWGRGSHPVINVSWEDARHYAMWLSHETGKPFRLPTESEWEYAARNRDKDENWAGTSADEKVGHYAVYAATSHNRTAPVGKRTNNSLGLYDMSGNVWEWVEDCWHDNYKDAPGDGLAWKEAGGENCSRRVARGGAWGDDPVFLRSSSRFYFAAELKGGDIGFRLAQDVE